MAPDSRVSKGLITMQKESVIATLKPRLVAGLADLIVNDVDKRDFLLMCSRVEAVIRAWYARQFEELMQLYTLFDPVGGQKRLEAQNLSPAQVEALEDRCLQSIFSIMEKASYKLLSDDEFALATSGHYLLDYPLAVDSSKLDMKLLARYFHNHRHENLPVTAREYLVFRRGIGLDRTTNFFYNEKIDMIIATIFERFLELIRLKKKDPTPKLEAVVQKKTDTTGPDSEISIESIRLETMPWTLKDLVGKTTIQEPTFERIILIYRPATPPHFPSELGNRAMEVKHFFHIPMADMEVVLPEKKNPGLSPQDWLRFIIAAVVGLYAILTSLHFEASLAVVTGIGSAFGAYISKIYASYKASIGKYQNLVMHSMYDKHLDSGRGTILNVCDEVVHQEVKEVILGYFVLMTQGKATKEELDRRCEDLLQEEFKEEVDFDVEDSITKLKKLGIVTKDAAGYYTHQSLKRANDIIGVTTEELVDLHNV